ncbi:MAG: ribosome biogenesis GTP-binding protein YihA/YsxC [Pseudomonadota bacterium]
MKIISSDFIDSVYNLHQLPNDGRTEIAFAGRSNVGKSSFINTILGRKKLAQVSKSPGRTQSLNFYLVNDSIYFVDLPGYGYAKVPVEMKTKWKHLIEGYLSNRPTLKLVVLLFDIRRNATEEDLLLLDWFRLRHIPVLTVLTKADKLSNNQCTAQLAAFSRSISADQNSTVAFSAVTRQGKDVVWEKILGFLPNAD